MNAFPLTPFLTMLAQDGIRVTINDYDRISLALNTGGEWTLNRLRCVLTALLAQNVQQEEQLLRRFNSFFEIDLKTDGQTALDLERALDDLRRVAQPPHPAEPDRTKNIINPAIKKDSRREPRRRKRLLWARLKSRLTIWHGVALALVIALVVTSFFVLRLRPVPQPPPAPAPEPESPVPQPPEAQITINVTGIDTSPVTLQRTWKDAAALIAVAGIPLFALGVFYWWRRKEDPVKTPSWDPSAKSHFPLSSIGGKPTARLDAETLSHLGDSLGYFQSEMLSRQLDVRASVEQTSRDGGMPALVFHRRKQLRTVYILEDGHAQALAWNPISQELAEGLRKRGINVAYGKFYGPPTKFYLDDGFIERLEDMEKHRGDYLLLIFSDSKCIQHRRDRFVLEALARWPMIAWMELREQRFWDESTAVIAKYRIPIYAASPECLSAAMERFLAELAPQNDFAEGQSRWRGAPAYVERYLHQHVERLLGDALLWAEACSMIQPVTQALADKLRVTFQPQLPPERFERLLVLPGTTQSVSGLRFSIPVLSVLRSGFAIRWDDEKQKEILQFIIDQIKEAEPDDKEGLAHLAWEWTLERVRLELSPDDALRRIAELERTPLGAAIRADLRYAMLPSAHLEEKDFINPKLVPLLAEPESTEAKRQLARLAENISEKDLTAGDSVGSKRRPFNVRKYVAAFLRHIKDWTRLLIDNLTPATVLSGARPGISIYPRKIVFNKVIRGRQLTRRMTIRAEADVWLTGRVHSPAEWISIKPHASQAVFVGSRKEQLVWSSSLFIDTIDQNSLKSEPAIERAIEKAALPLSDIDLFERSVEITAHTRNLLVGPHTGTVIVSLSDGDREIPVSVTVVSSFFEKCTLWWRDNRPSRALTFAFVSLALAIACVSLYHKLPANWVNRIYNHPPGLEGIAMASSDPSGILLDASASDPEYDWINYAWEYDGATKSSADGTFVLPVDVNSFRPTLDLKLRLTDDRGGESDYSVVVKSRADLVLKPIGGARVEASPPPGTATLIVSATTSQPGIVGAQLSIRGSSSHDIFLGVIEANKPKKLTLDPGRYSLKLLWAFEGPDILQTRIMELSAGDTRRVEFKYGEPNPLSPAHTLDAAIRSTLESRAPSPDLGGLTSYSSTTGAIEGTVYDSLGNPIGAATVESTNVETGLSRSTVTDRNGKFFVGILVPGYYNITASHIGYAESSLERFAVRLNKINVILPPSITLRPLTSTQPAQTGQIPAALQETIDLYNYGRYNEARDKCSVAQKTNPRAATTVVCSKNNFDSDEFVKRGGDPDAFAQMFKPARVLHQESAPYPLAFKTDPPSAMLVEVKIDASGNVSSANAMEGITLTGTSTIFDPQVAHQFVNVLFKNAEAAARRWTFEPAQMDQRTTGGAISNIASSQIIVIYFTAPASSR
jgi:hypothetical protein